MTVLTAEETRIGSGTPRRSPGPRDRRRSSRRPEVIPRRGSRRPGAPTNAGFPAVDAGFGSGPPHFPRSVQWRTRSVVIGPVQRRERHTTPSPTTCAVLRLGGVEIRSGHAGRRSGRQPVPALGAARLQHGPPGPGAHPSAEAMLLGSTTVVRLKGALHACLLVWKPTSSSPSGAGPARARHRNPGAPIGQGYGGQGSRDNTQSGWVSLWTSLLWCRFRWTDQHRPQPVDGPVDRTERESRLRW